MEGDTYESTATEIWGERQKKAGEMMIDTPHDIRYTLMDQRSPQEETGSAKEV